MILRYLRLIHLTQWTKAEIDAHDDQFLSDLLVAHAKEQEVESWIMERMRKGLNADGTKRDDQKDGNTGLGRREPSSAEMAAAAALYPGVPEEALKELLSG